MDFRLRIYSITQVKMSLTAWNINPVRKLKYASVPGCNLLCFGGVSCGKRRSVWNAAWECFWGAFWVLAYEARPITQWACWSFMHWSDPSITTRLRRCFSMVDLFFLVTFPHPKQAWWEKKGEIVKLPPQSASLQNMPSYTKTHETQNPKRHTANKSQRVSSKMFAKL